MILDEISTVAVKNELDEKPVEIAAKPEKSRRVLEGERGTYSSWISMRGRCMYPSTRGYKNYGGRGIKICERWMKFANFYADMGPRPYGHSIDRIDNNGNYEPSNCRWATRETQDRITRDRLLSHRGETLTVSQWASKLGFSLDSMRERIKRMSLERALSRFVGQKPKHLSDAQAAARANWDYIASTIALKGESGLSN